jgi:hypothetical protein
MKRFLLLATLVALMLFTSCTSTSHRPKPLAVEVTKEVDSPLLVLSINENDLYQAGYKNGDWVLIELDGMLIKALLASSASQQTTTLVAGPTSSFLYTPTAIRQGSSGLLIPYRPQQEREQSSVSFSGSFVFTL